MSTLYVDNLQPNLGSRVMAAGHVVQFKYDYSSTGTTITTNANSGGWVDVPVSVTITPTSTNSKIYIRLDMVAGNTTAGLGIDLRILRDTTVLQHRTNIHHRADGNVAQPNTSSHVFAYYDTPSTTSSVTYKFQCAFRGNNSGQFVINDASGGTTGADGGGTTLTVMEIAQ
jgi:hypothetical protein